MHDPVQAKHLEVTARPNEPGDRMIKRFTKKVRNDGVLQEFRSRMTYEKPSVAKRRKRAEAAAQRRADAREAF